MKDKGGGLDDGVPEIAIGSQTAKAWVEAEVPRLVVPPVHHCQAAHISVPGHHKPGYGVLVIEIPLSEGRPHWTKDNGRDVPYIRAGEHSLPMGLQTFLDLSSRTAASAGDILGLGQIADGEFHQQMKRWIIRFNPEIELVNGPPCKEWCVVVKPQNPGWYEKVPDTCNARFREDGVVTILGDRTLFPRVPTNACQATIEFHCQHLSKVTVSLSVGAAHPVVKIFDFRV